MNNNTQSKLFTNKPYKQFQHTSYTIMFNLLDKSKQVPRLSKTKQLQNPYQSNISTNGQTSRIFLLNDRQKVTLLEESDDQPQITVKKNVTGPSMRFPTFQPNKVAIDEMSEFGMECSSKQFVGEKYTQKDDSLQMGKYKQHSKQGNPVDIDPIKTVSININPNLNTKTTNIKPYQDDNILIHSPEVNKKQPIISTPQFTNNKPTKPTQKYQQKPSIPKKIPTIIQPQHNPNKKQHNSTYPSQQKQTHKQNNSLNNRQQNNNNDINKQLKQIRQLIREQVCDNSNIHRFSIYLSESRSEHKQQSYHIQQYNQQQIAQQQCTEHIFTKSQHIQQIQHINSKISIRNSQKLQLYKASRIVQLGQSNTNGNTNGTKHNRKGSIIDKIKQSGFIQSRIIDQQIQIKQHRNNQDNHKNQYIINNNNQYNIKKQYHDTSHYPKNIPHDNQYNNRQNKNSIYNNDRFNNNKMQQINKITQLKPQKQITTTNKKKRIKIFQISSNNKPIIFNQIYKPISGQKQQSKKYIHPSNKTPDKRISQLYQHHVVNTKYQPSPNNIQRYRQRYQNTGCPHTQCLIKSLEIIDKLTQPNHKKQHTCQHKNMMEQQCKIENSNLSVRKNRLQLQIENQSLQISMQVDKMLAQLMLPDLLQQQTTIKLKRLKIQIQNLISKIKKYQQQNQQFTKQSRFTSISAYKKPANTSRLSYRVQLSEQLQQICKILHYIQIVQQRYKMWKTRLYHLSQRIKNIFKVDKISQIKKLSDITQHISEIQGSKFYGNQVLEIGLVQAYNRFVDKQVQELKLTLQSAREWLRNKSQQF